MPRKLGASNTNPTRPLPHYDKSLQSRESLLGYRLFTLPP